ncbi:RNA methyltransferase [Reyranella sp. MMS21-HV4-11]|uniref:RNA methyltransferase n=1 Tax=Reyranella humidisoli TaxID=2849149 RepID=A0ABS6IN19_9HYPH|nr:RNA methyltransferase [Reyranella sp. MMS21-HV4-11]
MSITLDILEVGARGDGVADLEGKRFFVPYCLPAETVEAEPLDKRGDGTACDLVEVLAPSRHRVPAPCLHFGTCGGCALQHWRRDVYAGWKNDLIAKALAQRGVKAPTFEAPVTCEPGERRRADIVLRCQGKRILAGYHERGSQNVVDVGTCVVARPKINTAIAALRLAIKAILRDGTSADAVVNETDTGLDVLIRPHRKFELTLAIRETLIALAESADIARVSWGDRATAEPVIVRRTPQLILGDVTIEPPPGAFLQATKRAELVMRAGVTAWLGEAARTADLFAGIGALSLGKPGKLSLFEYDRPSVAAVDATARKLGGNRVAVQLRDLFRRPLSTKELDAFDAIVLDPPRAGAAAQCAELAASKVKRVVYGSCDPGSFARDVRTLQDGGYRLEKLMPIDQFLWSAHVELIALLTK